MLASRVARLTNSDSRLLLAASGQSVLNVLSTTTSVVDCQYELEQGSAMPECVAGVRPSSDPDWCAVNYKSTALDGTVKLGRQVRLDRSNSEDLRHNPHRLLATIYDSDILNIC